MVWINQVPSALYLIEKHLMFFFQDFMSKFILKLHDIVSIFQETGIGHYGLLKKKTLNLLKLFRNVI